jgi:hypothetical protein
MVDAEALAVIVDISVDSPHHGKWRISASPRIIAIE